MSSSNSTPSPQAPSLSSTQRSSFAGSTTIWSITATILFASLVLLAIENWSRRHSVDTRSGRMRTQWCLFDFALSSSISAPFRSFEGVSIADSPRWTNTGFNYWNGVDCCRAGKIPGLLAMLDAELTSSTCSIDRRRQIACSLLAWIDGSGNWYGCTIVSDKDALRAIANDGTIRWQANLCR